MICHRAASMGLESSAHAYLLHQAEVDACRVCHVGADDHAESARLPETPLLKVGSARPVSCAECHPKDGYSGPEAAHPWRVRGAASGHVQDPLLIPEKSPLPPSKSPLGFDWSGLLTLAYRFSDVSGSDDRFDTDLNLDSGLVMTEAGLRGRGETAWLDSLEVSARDIGDPYQAVAGSLEKAGMYRAGADWNKARYLYRASGDFHRVDVKNQNTSFDFSLELAENLSLDSSFIRSSRDGFWLTNRIGNRNLTPLTTIPGVSSPRREDADEFRVGLSGELYETAFNVGFTYFDESQDDRWAYSRQAPANPAFVESEAFRSQASLRGPGMDFRFERQTGPLGIEVSGRYIDWNRRINGEGRNSGFDVSEFVGSIRSNADGDAQSFVLDGSSDLELGESTNLLFTWHWLDHQEDLRLDQTEVTVFPSLGTSTTVSTNLDQHTAQRIFDGAVELEQELHGSLLISLGYGFSREWLNLPDLQPGDGDFDRGSFKNDGFLAGLVFKPDKHWSLTGRFSDYGQKGIELQELDQNDERQAEGRLRYRRDVGQAQIWVKHRHSSNQSSRFHYESNSYGVSASLQPRDDFDFFGSFSYTETDSRTLTNFYFDPDPNPLPTYVGFDGDTRNFSGGLRIEPSAGVHWLADLTYTDTNGSFDVRLLDMRFEFGVQVLPGGEWGLQYRRVDYQDESRVDAYEADLILLFWRQSFGDWR
jgi:hypothetical protein